MTEPLRRIEQIRSIFLNIQMLFAQSDDMNSIISRIESLDPDFRSIGYESMSMAIALKELQSCSAQLLPAFDPAGWVYFAEHRSSKHRAQVCVGLGWAIAKLNRPFLEIVQNINPEWRHRVADGCGYYDGTFRRRQVVDDLHLPAYIPANGLCMYHQGIGRSLWYSCGADEKKLAAKIKTFTLHMQPFLWRGASIAIAYIGGCYKDQLARIYREAQEFGKYIVEGSALAAASRIQADTMTADTDQCVRLWYEMYNDQLANITSGSLDTFSAAETIYQNWIISTEKHLAKTFNDLISA
jgi:enediyne biosynthesis protein E3